jgi:hypothetical protein
MTENDLPGQLTLLPSNVPVQFRIDADTRRRGLRHIAEIRLVLSQREARRAEAAGSGAAGSGAAGSGAARSERVAGPVGRRSAA